MAGRGLTGARGAAPAKRCGIAGPTWPPLKTSTPCRLVPPSEPTSVRAHPLGGSSAQATCTGVSCDPRFLGDGCPARSASRNEYCTKRPQYHYTRYTPSSAAGLSLILRMDRSTSAMIRLLTRGDQLVDPLSGVQRRPVRHPAQSVGQLDQRIRRPGRLREYHPRWARGTGCTHSRRQRSGVPPGSRHPSRSS